MNVHHVPVMVEQVLAALKPGSLGAYIDCTVGEGGHAESILTVAPQESRVLGVDLDNYALSTARGRLKSYADRTSFFHGSFANLDQISAQAGFKPADGVLFDLGMSSMQLQSADRGFSFSRPGRLDMRFDIRQSLTALQLVNGLPESDLSDILYRFGEERFSRRIARAIVRARPFQTTVQLATVVAGIMKVSRGGIHPATRVFQALRIAVNGEIDNLSAGLEQALRILRSGGRLAVISYHSLEDRVVKRAFRRESSVCVCPPETPICICCHEMTVRLINRKVITPSRDEQRQNPRSRSARMRVIEKL